MDEQMDGWMDRWMDRWTDGWMGGQMDGWMDGQMDGWVNSWKDKWNDGYMEYITSLTYSTALELTFSTTLLSTWENRTIDVPIKPQGIETPVTDQNKVDYCFCNYIDNNNYINLVQKEYVQCLAQFKIQECTNAETWALQKGFWKVIAADGWMDRQTNGRMDRWMDGWTDR